MSANARLFVLVLGIGCTLGGVALMAGASPGGVVVLGTGLVILASLAFERRYGRPGDAPPIRAAEWQRTGEKFVDDETGERLEVWMDPLTGARRYEPLGHDPRLTDRMP